VLNRRAPSRPTYENVTVTREDFTDE
jgi:hypothetical protein